jgi:hypothetical protein
MTTIKDTWIQKNRGRGRRERKGEGERREGSKERVNFCRPRRN